MRRQVLVDTSGLVALYLPSDSRHGEAAAILTGLREKKRLLLATMDVFDETATLVRRWAGEMPTRWRRASRFARAGCWDSSRWRKGNAWKLFKSHQVAKRSFTD